MNNQLDENEVIPGDIPAAIPTALYKVSFLYKQRDLEDIDMILDQGKKNRNNVRKMIASLKKVHFKEVTKVKFRFRKELAGYVQGVDGTNQYQQRLLIEKEIRKQLGIQKRRYKIQEKVSIQEQVQNNVL
jgi:hypothetical protein